ncbi:PLP-dependent aminotransferase family protein [Sphingobacterium sp. SGL-16]|uniref:aminotransferase-like domain-containing protein n=1 Tax=Sphingobacterium sp. SGL-16 TaxID=2710883 RepID=UPI0013EAEC13|nr:PLP-dependent aminotransferase family protein [Sphingobacterium sp. SGL-16]NGM74309.1 PLP-dependent aminotransferase family protein [Sphingobacterium sp. SGL-16]
MNSPVLQNILAYIKINKMEATAIYLQIAQGLINAIQTKAVKTGDKLPGTRTLSEKLYLHRKTVVAAYDELVAQGWIDIIPQIGAFVSNKKIKTTSIQLTEKAFNSIKTPYEVMENYILDSPYIPIATDLYFTDGTGDFRLLDFKILTQIFNALTKKKTTARAINKNFHVQNMNLKQQFLNYLYITKRFTIPENQLLIFQNNQIAFQSILQTLFRPNDTVIVTEIGHFETNMKLKHAQVNLITVITNQDGIDLQHFKSILNKQKIRALYIQTNQLYPTTISLTEENKKQLIELAYEHQFIIIEDDNGTDFVYHKNQISTLKNLDSKGSVVYVNSLKDLFPHPYDLAYIIVPENLILELSKAQNIWQSTAMYLIEETLAEYINEGLLLRQLQKQTKIYQKRRDYFASILDQHFEQSIHFEKPEIGLGFWIQLNKRISLLAIANLLRAKNLTLPNYLLYQNRDLTALRLGFAHLNEQEAEEATTLLSKGIYEYMYN